MIWGGERNRSSVAVAILDTLRAEALDARMLPSLPALQSLVRESYTFSRAYAPSHWTIPSHASLITGMMPGDHGAHPPELELLPNVTTFAEIFRDESYFTACVSCNPHLSHLFGLTRGFEVVWNTSKPWTNNVSLGYEFLSKILGEERDLPRPIRGAIEKVGAVLRSSPRSDNGAREAVSFTRQLLADRKGSTLLLLNLMEAHHPYHGRGVHSDWKHRFRHSEVFGHWERFVMGVMAGRLEISDTKHRILERTYWENVRYLDSQLGSFLIGLPSRFLDESFLIVLSDHGQLLGEKGKIDHISGLSESLIRVPLLVRPPGGNDGIQVDHPVNLSMVFDLLRLIASGHPAPIERWLEQIQEVDSVFSEAHGGLVPHLLPLVGHPPTYREDMIAFRRWEDHPALCCIVGHWKLICFLGRKDDELFDLKSDPSEQVNLVSRNPSKLEELHGRLATRFAKSSHHLTEASYTDRLSAGAKRRITEVVLQEVFDAADRPALLWTGGKDSNLVLFLTLKIAGRDGQAPPLLVFVDHGQHFDETFAFMDDIVESEGLHALVARNDDVLAAYGTTSNTVRLESLNGENQEEALRIGFDGTEVPLDLQTAVGNHLLKTVALKQAIRDNGFDFIITGIRWDENPARAAEVFFSPREDPPHTRVHPILPWTEMEVWNHTLEEGLPIHPLYRQGYRSFDGVRDSKPTSMKPAWEQDLEATKERAGRAQDKEEIMEQLRSLGYF